MAAMTSFHAEKCCRLVIAHRAPIQQIPPSSYSRPTHSVTCHPTQVNTPRLNPSQAGRYSINLPRRDRRLSWPRWLYL